MSNYKYCIGDPHIGHFNMALKRGFSNVDEHDQHVINGINSVVKKRDILYLMGDLTMHKNNYAWLELINCNMINVILGNHDTPNHIRSLLNYVHSVAAVRSVNNCWLTHIPIHPQELYRIKLNIHAHLHEKVIKRYGILNDNRYKCVSAEQINYIPFKLEK